MYDNIQLHHNHIICFLIAPTLFIPFSLGSLEYLEQPTLAFVRLAAGVDLENVVALPIPVRFLFVLLGPTREDFDYHEIGRSISTLMSDEVITEYRW